MERTQEHGSPRAQLEAWYFGSLRVKLTRAVEEGVVEAAALAALDRQLGELLDLDHPATKAA